MYNCNVRMTESFVHEDTRLIKHAFNDTDENNVLLLPIVIPQKH